MSEAPVSLPVLTFDLSSLHTSDSAYRTQSSTGNPYRVPELGVFHWCMHWKTRRLWMTGSPYLSHNFTFYSDPASPFRSRPDLSPRLSKSTRTWTPSKTTKKHYEPGMWSIRGVFTIQHDFSVSSCNYWHLFHEWRTVDTTHREKVNDNWLWGTVLKTTKASTPSEDCPVSDVNAYSKVRIL